MYEVQKISRFMLAITQTKLTVRSIPRYNYRYPECDYTPIRLRGVRSYRLIKSSHPHLIHIPPVPPDPRHMEAPGLRDVLDEVEGRALLGQGREHERE